MGGGSDNGNFSLLYVLKISLCRLVGGSNKPQNTLTMAFYANLSFLSDPKSHMAEKFEIYLCVVRYRFEPLLGGLFLSLPNVNEEEKE